MHLALILTLLASPAFGETQHPLVHSPAPLALIDSLPHLTSPDAAAAGINLDMRRRDRAVMAAALDCGATSAVDGRLSGEFGWERGVTVTIPGPRYLAILVSDTAWCGGPHAAESRFSLVYDLQTGLPVDWTALLPVAWVRGQAASPDAPPSDAPPTP